MGDRDDAAPDAKRARVGEYSSSTQIVNFTVPPRGDATYGMPTGEPTTCCSINIFRL
jgi:hypothetical protein